MKVHKDKTRPFSHKDFMDVEYLIEIMQESAYSEAGEYAEDYLEDLTKEKKEELQKILIEWFTNNAKELRFY